MTLENIFSEKNLLEYSNACLELAVVVPETRKNEGFDTLVIPSRGAVPFFLGMCYSLNKIKSFGGDHELFYNDLGVQNIIASLLPEQSCISEDIENSKVKVIVVPFTADLNISKFEDTEGNEEYTFETRKYWANVTSSFFKEQRERKKDPYFISFTNIILRDIEGREEVAKRYEDFPQIKKFSIIDTVISGRASNQILQSFDSLSQKEGNENLKPSSFLIIDEEGTKLKPHFKSYLLRKKLEGKVVMQYVPRIVSEDEGASFLGVSAIVYPSLMKSSKNFEINGEEFFMGAGSWHLGSDLGKNYSDNFKKFMEIIYRGIDFLCDRDYFEENDKKSFEIFKEKREDFLKYASENKILSKSYFNLSPLGLNKKYIPQNPYETGSHVVHIPFKKKSNEKIMFKIASIPGIIKIPKKVCDKRK